MFALRHQCCLLCSTENSDIIFKVITLEIFPPSFSIQAQQQQAESRAPIKRFAPSLQLCPVPCWAFCCESHPPASQTLMPCSQPQQKVPRVFFPGTTRPSSLLPRPHNVSRTRKGYLCGWGRWGQALDFGLDFAALVNYWIDCAAHGRLAALLALGKKTRQGMAPRSGVRGWLQPASSSLKVH